MVDDARVVRGGGGGGGGGGLFFLRHRLQPAAPAAAVGVALALHPDGVILVVPRGSHSEPAPGTPARGASFSLGAVEALLGLPLVFDQHAVVGDRVNAAGLVPLVVQAREGHLLHLHKTVDVVPGLEAGLPDRHLALLEDARLVVLDAHLASRALLHPLGRHLALTGGVAGTGVSEAEVGLAPDRGDGPDRAVGGLVLQQAGLPLSRVVVQRVGLGQVAEVHHVLELQHGLVLCVAPDVQQEAVRVGEDHVDVVPAQGGSDAVVEHARHEQLRHLQDGEADQPALLDEVGLLAHEADGAPIRPAGHAPLVERAGDAPLELLRVAVELRVHPVGGRLDELAVDLKEREKA